MKITEKDVQYVADLSRLSLTEDKIKLYTEQLEQILEFIDKLNKLDVSDVEPTAAVLDIKNVKRRDEVKKTIDKEEILKNAPKREDDFFTVPQVIKG